MARLSEDQFGTPHMDEMDRVMQGNRLRHPAHADPKYGGGEWDTLKGLPPRTQRRLTGAGYLTPKGMKPDEASDIITEHVNDVSDHDTAIEWYAKTALGAMGESRKVARRGREQRQAESQGYKSIHQLRTFQAVLEGHDTYAAKRKARGWD